MLTITRRLANNPFQTTTTLEHRLTRFLNDAFGPLESVPVEGPASAWVPAVDVFEDADAIRIVAEVPGVSPEDVKISHEDNVLTIQGTKQQATQDRTERVHRDSEPTGLRPTFTLPTTVGRRHQGGLSARCPDGHRCPRWRRKAAPDSVQFAAK
jgi:HSP20 family protein